MTRFRVDMAVGSSGAFSPLPVSVLLELPRLWIVCLRSAPAQSDPGGELLVRKKVRERGGARAGTGEKLPSLENELPGLAFLAGTLQRPAKEVSLRTREM
jgi:hypothetical protein